MRSMAESMDSKKSFQRKGDPLDQRIRQLIEDHVLSTPLGKQMMKDSHALQADYYKDSLSHSNDPSYIHRKNQELLAAIAKATNSRIIEGERFLDEVPSGKPIFAMVNHFSVYKLTSIEQEALGIKTDELDDIPPPQMHFAAVYPVAQKLGLNLYDAHLELPEPLLTIQRAEGFIGVPRAKGQFEEIFKRTKEHIAQHPNSMTVIFPEGGTSGKANNGGPFDMLPFHKGTFIMAGQLGIPILPTAQYFNPETGFEIGVFRPFTLGPNLSAEEYSGVADKTRIEMQNWLDSQKIKTS